MTSEEILVAKKAHAQAIVDSLTATKALIASETDLYWPALPQVLFQATSNLDMVIRNLRDVYGMAEPETPPPAYAPAPPPA